MDELTWENISCNLEDALEELKRLNERALLGDMPDEVEFRIAMQHIYHHLNFAWNTRHESVQNYAGMMNEEFKQWGKFPKDLELL